MPGITQSGRARGASSSSSSPTIVCTSYSIHTRINPPYITYNTLYTPAAPRRTPTTTIVNGAVPRGPFIHPCMYVPTYIILVKRLPRDAARLGRERRGRAGAQLPTVPPANRHDSPRLVYMMEIIKKKKKKKKKNVGRAWDDALKMRERYAPDAPRPRDRRGRGSVHGHEEKTFICFFAWWATTVDRTQRHARSQGGRQTVYS